MSLKKYFKKIYHVREPKRICKYKVMLTTFFETINQYRLNDFCHKLKFGVAGVYEEIS